MSDGASQPSVRQRKVEQGPVVTDSWSANLVNGSWVDNTHNKNLRSILTTQKTVSEGHPWNRSNDYPGDDVGGPFETTKSYIALDRWGLKPLKLKDAPKYALQAVIPGGGTRYSYYGNLLPTSRFLAASQSDAFPVHTASSDAALAAWGTKAIALTKPTNSIANLSVSLAELMREGIPKSPGRSFWEDRARTARGAGSEYLNAQFGWLPLIADIGDVATAISKGDKIWKQYQRDSGRLVRRRFEFDPVVSTPVEAEVRSGVYPFPSLNSYFFQAGGPGGTYRRTLYKQQRRWFSGAFTYYVPDRDTDGKVDALYEHAAKARKLYGLTLDPEVLWNLTPWSWAADWFANTGDVISNLTDMATDGLVLRYGYMMETTISSYEHSLEGVRWALPGAAPSNLTLYGVTVTKKRVRATPYGFGLTWSNFSPRQLAILAALGVTQGR